MKPKPDLYWENEDVDEVDEVEGPWMNMLNGRGISPVEEQETPDPPFTPAQLEYIENLLEKTIKRLGVTLETGTSNDWYSSGIRIEVKLTYAGEDGSYTHDVLESSSDTFTFPSHRCERDY